ncbi:MAG: iron-containing alcohol dehydrogenase [Deltaproteobacteria bacterium]|nr:iron-containing alcohol dehydrogenase [Deltaproteobacteria bacterium]
MDRKRMAELQKRAPQNLAKPVNLWTSGLRPPQQFQIGLGVSQQVGTCASKLTEGKKALVVSDEVLCKIGTVDTMVSFLDEAGFSVEIFTNVEPEPHVETADAIYEQYIERDISVMVGLGGGSVMDMSKLAAQALGNNLPPHSYADSKATPNNGGLPLILLPTTSGTGSEVSTYVVVTCGQEKRFFSDPHWLPNVSLIDPILTVSMPPSVTATTGMDALTHAVEGIMNVNNTPMCEALCLSAIDRIAKCLRRAVAVGEDLEARYNMLVGSSMAMMGFNMAGGGLYAHSVSFVIPVYKPAPHGLGCALGLPYLMDYNLQTITDRLSKIANAMGEPVLTNSQLVAAKKAVHAVISLMKDIGLPLTLKDFGINEDDVEKMAVQMIEIFPRPFNPRPMNKEDSIKYWRAMYDGRLVGSCVV